MQYARRIANPTRVHRHIHDLLLHGRRLSSVGICQEKRPPTLRARAAPITLFALPCRAMSHNIGAVTVGAVQDLSHHDTTRSCWVALSAPCIKDSRSTLLEHLQRSYQKSSRGQTATSVYVWLDYAEEACRLYATRFPIETFFSDQKSRGFHLHKSPITDHKLLSHLLRAACLAYFWIVSLGAFCTKKGHVDILHRRRCDVSLFQLGLRMLDYFLNEDLPIPVAFHICSEKPGKYLVVKSPHTS